MELDYQRVVLANQFKQNQGIDETAKQLFLSTNACHVCQNFPTIPYCLANSQNHNYYLRFCLDCIKTMKTDYKQTQASDLGGDYLFVCKYSHKGCKQEFKYKNLKNLIDHQAACNFSTEKSDLSCKYVNNL
jgi:hypothetical protein